ncbi:MAG: GPI inositol-deacylase [Bacteroidales bacterium]|nr:GPI inositol-deacylase [Bacteroidales bacterium]MCF8456282.1 GPI inositol-deacylase [Bacteroidales bacterium]
MENVIIAIHGLGNKAPKPVLENWWKQAIMEGLTHNSYKAVLPKFEMVYWADILYGKPLDELETNPESPYFLKEKYVKATADFAVEDHSTRKKVVEFLARQMNKLFLNEDFSLNYSFITDTLISKYFKDLEIYYTENCTFENKHVCEAKVLIRERLLKTLEKYKDENIMLLSHSMGSIVAYDVLTFLAPQLKVNTFVTMGSPLGLPVVISKIAAEQKQRMNHVNHMQTPPGVVKNWYNFSDIMDKVAFEYKLSGDFSENSFGVKPIDYLVVNNYVIDGERNPHKSYGYLRTPEFSKVMNEFILAEKLSLKEKVVRKTLQIVNVIKEQFSPEKKETSAA